jgi:hypothetical protein
VLEMLEVQLEQEPLRGRAIRKAAVESFIKGFFCLVSSEPARCFPPSLQIFPGQPFGADWTVVDKNIVPAGTDHNLCTNSMAE